MFAKDWQADHAPALDATARKSINTQQAASSATVNGCSVRDYEMETGDWCVPSEAPGASGGEQKCRMAKKLKLQQEQAVIPARNSGLGAKTVTSGENARQIQRPPPAGPNPT
jgi:hypothetical protein